MNDNILNSVLNITILYIPGVDKLIVHGTERKMKSFMNLKTKGEFLPVPRSTLGKGYNDQEEEESDEEKVHD